MFMVGVLSLKPKYTYIPEFLKSQSSLIRHSYSVLANRNSSGVLNKQAKRQTVMQ